MITDESRSGRDEAIASYTLRELVLYFWRLGYTGFGGPIALVGYMQRDPVETRRWFSIILFAVSAVATAWTESEVVWLLQVAGVVALIPKLSLRGSAPAASV